MGKERQRERKKDGLVNKALAWDLEELESVAASHRRPV